MYNHSDYTIPIDTIDLKRVLKSWLWLVGEEKQIVALTKLGDLLLNDNKNKLYFLDTGNGKLKFITENYFNFTKGELGNNDYEEILLSFLIDKLESSNMHLKKNQVYSFRKLPIMGGRYNIENIFALDLYEHFDLTGEIHFQIKDLPEGSRLDFEVGP